MVPQTANRGEKKAEEKECEMESTAPLILPEPNPDEILHPRTQLHARSSGNFVRRERAGVLDERGDGRSVRRALHIPCVSRVG